MPPKSKKKKADEATATTPSRRSQRISGADYLDTQAQVRSVKVFFSLYNSQWKGKSPLNWFKSVEICPVLFCFVLFVSRQQSLDQIHWFFFLNYFLKNSNWTRLAGTFLLTSRMNERLYLSVNSIELKKKPNGADYLHNNYIP